MAAPQAMEMESPQSYSPEARNTQLNNIRSLLTYLLQEFQNVQIADFVSSKTLDLDLSNSYAGVVSTVYNHIRKSANTNVVSRGNDYSDMQCTILGNVKTTSVLANGFKIKNPTVVWDFRLAGPLVDMLTAFKMVWDETRLSCSKFKYKRGSSSAVEKGIGSFGLSNVHLPLLTGITYKPERRTGLMRTLGPLTTALMLANEKKYPDKMANSLKESIKMLPMADYIISALKDADSAENCRSLLASMGDLLLIIGSRSTNKIYFPILFILFTTNDIDFSGKLGFLNYIGISHSLTWCKKSDGIAEDIAQVVFHSMFGTSCEDLGILSQITTNNSWKTRKELSSVFTKKTDKVKKFTPILFKYISKAASASQMKSMGTAQPMLSNKIVFSGSRKRNYSHAFLTYLETGNNQVSYGRDIYSLTNALIKLKEEYTKQIRNGTLSEAGTTKWLMISENNVTETDFVATESGSYFYS
uniref:Uncharacterized protein n=1 Tax=Ceratitis capitata TaxID=7213 RepID=W8BV85_CERCA